ncbi:MAG: NAD(+) kinase [Bdellovibrio sp.]|nr:MAG: NAD(+) kinase [Bdellovibrio sp.]
MRRTRRKPALIRQNPSVALVYRQETSASFGLAETLSHWLKERKQRVYTAPEQKPIPGTRLLRSFAEFRKMGLIVVLGGDGTYLRAVRLMDGASIPILGINMGSLGFLTPVRAEEVFAALDLTLKNEMQLVPRSMLEIELVQGSKLSLFCALNDVVIERGRMSQLINLSIQCGDDFVSEVKADGLIISTPTGSTAYNLSAGGPLLHPRVQGMVVTPIAPHSLTSRPLIFPDDEHLHFRIVSKVRNSKAASERQRKRIASAQLIVDGRSLADVSLDDRINVRRSPREHWRIEDPKKNFFFLLRDKLKFGDRA